MGIDKKGVTARFWGTFAFYVLLDRLIRVAPVHNIFSVLRTDAERDVCARI